MNNLHCIKCGKSIEINEEFRWKQHKFVFCMPCYNESKGNPNPTK